MIYHEKVGHLPFLKAKKVSDDEEDYVPQASDFGVLGGCRPDEEKDVVGVTETGFRGPE